MICIYLRIIISGCSPSVYRVIDADEQYKYCNILEPPHKRPVSVALLRKMKQFWSLGPTFFDWAHGLPGVGVVPSGILYGNQAATIEEDDSDGDDSDV